MQMQRIERIGVIPAVNCTRHTGRMTGGGSTVYQDRRIKSDLDERGGIADRRNTPYIVHFAVAAVLHSRRTDSL